MNVNLSITSEILKREATLKGKVSKEELLKFIEDNWIEVDPEPYTNSGSVRDKSPLPF